jgi:hypothetical protein
MPFKTALFFVPGWTFLTGSPHLALPLLRSFLESNGIDVVIRDLNHEFVKTLNIEINAAHAFEACASSTLEDMNAPYFAAEDRLGEIANKHDAEWNAQIGFTYRGSPQNSSRTTIQFLTKDSPFDGFYEDSVLSMFTTQAPDLIGLCIAATQQLIPALQLAHKLRSTGYDGFIVLGGNTISRLFHELSVPWVFDIIDGLIVFQGELSLLELCRALQSDQMLDRVTNLIWRNTDGKIIQNPISGNQGDLNALPPPDYSGLAIGQYWGQNYLNIVAARGCYYGKCSFCAIPFGWGPSGYAGTRSPDQTYRDMLILAELHGVSRFKFVDEALSPSFMRALSKRIIADKTGFEWEGYVRLEPAWYDSDFVAYVSRAGFRKGYFGLEIVPSNRRKLLAKNDRPQPKHLLNQCSSAGIKPHLFCMFGYPGTGEEEAAETVEFLLKHQHQIDTADIFPWTYAKHTRVPGIEPVLDPDQDWVVEYDHVSTRKDVLSSMAVKELTAKYEEIVWREVPRFLHPTYRLVSPWTP